MLCVLVVGLEPGALIGAGLFFLIVRCLDRERLFLSVASVLGLGLIALLHQMLVIGWPWQLAFDSSFGHAAHVVIPIALALDVCAGPTLLLCALVARDLLQNTMVAQLRFQRVVAFQRFDAVKGHVDVQRIDHRFMHPAGRIRLGRDVEDQRHFDLAPSELDEHVFIPGASGSGKTTTVGRIADGVAGLGYGVVIVDCKGGDLKEVGEEIAHRNRLPFYLVDPDDETSLGYDPCSGSPLRYLQQAGGHFRIRRRGTDL